MIISAVGDLITSLKQKKLAKGINPVDATYQSSPFINDLYYQGKNLYQGRMAGANEAQNNILVNASNTRDTVDRSATSGSQALAIAAGTQGQADQSFQNLATQEAQDKQQRFGIYSNVSQLQAQEGDKVYQDKLRKYYDDLNYKRALQGASMQNMQGFFNGLDDTAKAALSLVSPGGLLAGGGGGGGGNSGGGLPSAVPISAGVQYPSSNQYRQF